MRTLGIITIHRIYNYGSVFQAYALQELCRSLKFKVEIIDYIFPNRWHSEMSSCCMSHDPKTGYTNKCESIKQFVLKLLFVSALFRQHSELKKTIRELLNLSSSAYSSPEKLLATPPQYDVYMSGSDQIWNPRYCKCDPAFLLHFAPEAAAKISYASSFGIDYIEGKDEQALYSTLLARYSAISVREQSGVTLAHRLTGKEVSLVLDPTLLLNSTKWNEIAVPKRVVTGKYILCYYLNYSFNAFPRANEIADYIQKLTGYKIVYVARPPQRLFSPYTIFKVGASPAEFLALIRDAELVLTTSFHGTAFAINYNRPLYSIVSDKQASDSRQVSLLNSVGLSDRILSINDEFPNSSDFFYCDYERCNDNLEKLKETSFSFLKKACGVDDHFAK